MRGLSIISARFFGSRRPAKPVEREAGASLVEYALLLALVALATLVALHFLGGSVANSISSSGSSLFPGS